MATISMPHIGLGGHLIPASRVGRVLSEQGHRVIAWAPERYRAQLERTGVELRIHEPADTRRPFPSFAEFAAVVAEGTRDCAERLIEELLAESVELVVHDVHVPWGRVAGEFLGLPRIVTNPLFPALAAPSGPMPAPAETRSGTPAGGGDGFERAVARVEAAREAVATRWGVDLGGWQALIQSRAEHVISFTTEEILGLPRLPDGWVCAGPLLPPPARSPAAPARPLVYAAFGTFFNGQEEVFRTVLDALADAPVDVLLSTGGGPVRPRDLEPVPANADVREFVDSAQVLGGAAVHVTHGGGGSVNESLLAGVPMVCVPLGSDQSLWADRVQQLGAGWVVALQREAIRSAVTALVPQAAPERTRARRLASSLAARDGAGMIARLVEEALGTSS